MLLKCLFPEEQKEKEGDARAKQTKKVKEDFSVEAYLGETKKKRNRRNKKGPKSFAYANLP